MKTAHPRYMVLLSLMVSAGAALPADLPERLSETGLYQPGTHEIAHQNLAYSPQYPLWSDGAIKRRWLFLPAGSAIDATRPDAWEFPPGTKLWKEFAFDQPVETRMIERLADGSWRFATYAWDEQAREAILVAAAGHSNKPVSQAPTGRYDYPSRDDCLACHEGGKVPVLGLSTLQLSPDRDPHAAHAEPWQGGDLDLNQLVSTGRLVNLPEVYLEHPPRIEAESPISRAALGYLHANCGHCHNAAGSLALLEMEMNQEMEPQNPRKLQQSLNSLLQRYSDEPLPGAELRIAAGRPDASALFKRMNSTDPMLQMPPLGRNLIDLQGVRLVSQWIEQLPIDIEEARP